MAFHWTDNVHTTAFTPRDYQVELLAACYESNTMICLGHQSSKEFIALKLIQELGGQMRKEGNIVVYLTQNGASSVGTMVKYLTDLKVYQENPGDSLCSMQDGLYNVFILSPYTCRIALHAKVINFAEIGLLILEDCHQSSLHHEILSIYKSFYHKKSEGLKMLGLAGPLHGAACPMQELGAMLDALEKRLDLKTETASDIVSVLRYSAKPIEYIVQCAPFEIDELSIVCRDILNTHRNFLIQHRYDPLEIYQMDEFADELKDIPDPKKEPLEYIDMMLKVLHELGPWSAYRLAFNMFKRIDKQKIKTPHERHFLLLNFVNTAFLELHAICEKTFRKIENRSTAIETYSSPKVLRLLNILRLFRPDEPINDKFKKVMNDIDKQNFRKITRELENVSLNIERICKSTSQSRSIIDNLIPLVKDSKIEDVAEINMKTNNLSKIIITNQSKSAPNRNKRRAFHKRIKRDDDQLDSLCGIIFCTDNYMPKVLFDLLIEMSRHDSDLKYLNCQYTTDRSADPLTDPIEAELEHRRQEEVLKSFRMHDCNVLIGTSVLEEGIDLPKCNLVIRWDEPNSYRSYVHSKGRAKAAQSYHVILVGPKFDISSYNSGKEKQLSSRSHIYICNLNGSEETVVSSDSETEKENLAKDKSYTFGSSKGTVKVLNPEVITNIPPTNSSLSLKEIKDEQPSIKDSINHKESVRYDSVTYDVKSVDEVLSNLDNEFTQSVIKELIKPKLPSPEVQKKPPVKFQCTHSISKYEPNVHDYKQNLKKMEESTSSMVEQLATYREIEKMLLEKCANKEPCEVEHNLADEYNPCILPYKPISNMLTSAHVDLSNAIALVNKYCSKLPSDTFTRLTPIWRCATTIRKSYELFQYTIRLPINSPLKYDIVGIPMASNVLARRMAAMQTCVELHKIGELDDNLQPIGKEHFKPIDPDWEDFDLEPEDEKIIKENLEPRPGTTKRRQYYYKRIASQFCHCRPTVGTPCYLYLIDLTLKCPIPEEQNTRGRKIYPPEDALQGFGVLTLKQIPKISSFPIFTRSGEVRVSVRLSSEKVVLTKEEIESINIFVNFTFTNVLRLQKFLMLFDPDSMENCIFIVPTIKTDFDKTIDWDFLHLIERKSQMVPREIPEKVRKRKEFDPNKFKDAVVMPWYRNQDQPQYFYVAEICPNLNPLSCFPGENYNTFKHYYNLKYGIHIQNCDQPLLDVDHTSARLNFLTPRYVNRKGVALPTSSEETKRAKRENLEQKQILVPELCTVHPFPASLWRTAVCLPCILYRINGLLLADDIRRKVAADIGLGKKHLRDDFEWPMLDFGWSLSEVLRKAKETECNKETQDISSCPSKEKQTINKKTEKDKRQVTIYYGDGSIVYKDVSDDEDVHFPKSANEIVCEAEKELQENDFIEIGTWSNDMANDLSDNSNEFFDEAEEFKFLPPNVKFCDRQTRYGSPTFFDIKPHHKTNGMKVGFPDDYSSSFAANKKKVYNYNQFYSDDSSLSSYDGCSENEIDDFEDEEASGRIAFSKNEAETFETEEEQEKRKKQLSIIEATNANELNYQKTKNMLVGYDFEDIKKELCGQINYAIAKFARSTHIIRNDIWKCGMLVKHDESIEMSKKWTPSVKPIRYDINLDTFSKLIPYVHPDVINKVVNNGQNMLTIYDLIKFNRDYVAAFPKEVFFVEGFGDIFDRFNDYDKLEMRNSEGGKLEKCLHLNFDSRTNVYFGVQKGKCRKRKPKVNEFSFSFDYQPDLNEHPGPSPSIILQGLTMSNANDGINLERLETIGDSFLKYAITTYLYITYENVHEGKLSHLRSKQVANLNLYRLGRRKNLGEYMIATKFEPHDNWLPPCYYVPKELEKAYIEAKIPPHHWKLADLPNIKKLSSSEICQLVREKAEKLGLSDEYIYDETATNETEESLDYSCFIPYNLVTQHSIPDKSVADCVEALIGAYLIECGPRGALLFMAWLGIRVLPIKELPSTKCEARIPGSTKPDLDDMITIYGDWSQPKSPLLYYSPFPEKELEDMLEGFDNFEDILGYKFRDRSYLLQAMTHASYSPNRLTDCYQRLEFLGDAVLDYLITRHLYEDPRQHSPGALTDLRSALVNNTIFASLAVRHGFHKYFRHLSPGLNEVIDRFVRIQNENGHIISEEVSEVKKATFQLSLNDFYLLSEEECDDAEDVEVPKALGDVFESVAGAIFLDSGMSLDAVWEVYSNMMSPEIEQFSNSVPKSPIRELLELEPETAKFGKPEKLADGRRVRVTVEVFSKGIFRGIGRNYRIAKCTAAKCALRYLKRHSAVKRS